MNGIRIFSLAGIPVFISPWVLALMAYYVFVAGSFQQGLTFMGAVVISVLVHEFGHGFMARHYKLSPEILIHGFGGLCAHQRSKRDLHDVLILLAGPGLGIFVALLVQGLYLALALTNPQMFTANPMLAYFFDSMWWVGFIWNFVNLVPLFPLDGGQLFRIGAVKVLGGRNGERATHILGATLGGVAMLVSWFMFSSLLLTAICGFIVYHNVNYLRSGRASGAIRTQNRFAQELYAKSRKAMEAGDWREAARLGHQIRAESNLSDGLLEKVWVTLSVSTANLGEHEEALGYIKRAPQTPMVAEAKVRCLAELGRTQEAREALTQQEAAKLPQKTREALEGLIAKKEGS